MDITAMTTAIIVSFLSLNIIDPSVLILYPHIPQNLSSGDIEVPQLGHLLKLTLLELSSLFPSFTLNNTSDIKKNEPTNMINGASFFPYLNGEN
jgi:hypothetical protein